MYLVRKLRSRSMLRRIEDERRFYEAFADADAASQWQLDRFNEIWAGLVDRVPYYKQLKHDRQLPDRFPGWADVHERLPIHGRADVQTHTVDMTDPSRPPDSYHISGGSTGQPTHLPAWACEDQTSASNIWLGRSWFDISPADRLFLIWGHSHLLGQGWRGKRNAWERRLRDWLAGYYRHSAYRMDKPSLQQAGRSLLRFRPEYVIGYSVALEQFANANQELAEAMAQLPLKAVIATAEGFASPAGRDMVQRTFGCPIAMEYGTAETGPVAYETPEGGYRVFWRYFYLEAVPSEHVPGAHELLITTLYPRCFPLVRYRLGDLVTLPPHHRHHGLTAFDTIIGRSSDVFELPGGTSLHSGVISQSIKTLPKIREFQVYVPRSAQPRIRYQSTHPLSAQEEQELRRKLTTIHSDLGNIHLERVDAMSKTVAGKTPLVLRE